jgi:hypothetical protein
MSYLSIESNSRVPLTLEGFLAPVSPRSKVTRGGRFANLRVLYGYMYALPGDKLLFMGSEIGQWTDASCRQFTPFV